jgi:hypothetical protein
VAPAMAYAMATVAGDARVVGATSKPILYFEEGGKAVVGGRGRSREAVRRSPPHGLASLLLRS